MTSLQLTHLCLLLLLFHISLPFSQSHSCIPRDDPRSVAIQLPATKLNDDYCDCIDGSDETLTAACPNGKFVCRNLQFKPVLIPASRVNDGVCDCCDGSDEISNCEDVCAKEKTNLRKQLQKRLHVVQRGLRKRAQYEKRVSVEIRKEERELRSLKAQLSSVEKQLEGIEGKLKVVKQINVGQSDHAKDDSGSGEIDAGSSVHEHNEDRDDDEEEEEEDDDDDDEDDDNDFEDEDDMEDDDAEYNPEEPENKKDENDDVDDDDDDEEEDEGRDDDDYDRAAHSRATESSAPTPPAESTTTPVSETADDHSSASPETCSASNANCAAATAATTASPDMSAVCGGLLSRGALAARLHGVLYRIQDRLHVLTRVIPAPNASSALSACASQLQTQSKELKSRESDLRRQIEALTKKASIAFSSPALRSLHGQCFKRDIGKYEFEHCAFAQVKQYENGRMIASLGKFKGWMEDGLGWSMQYTGGDQCWNGPQRSAIVNLKCGMEERVESVEESERCRYVIVFETPAVCEQVLVKEIEEEMK